MDSLCEKTEELQDSFFCTPTFRQKTVRLLAKVDLGHLAHYVNSYQAWRVQKVVGHILLHEHLVVSEDTE